MSNPHFALVREQLDPESKFNWISSDLANIAEIIEGNAQATLALAYEQRTANLIAYVAQIDDTSASIPVVSEIRTRLQITGGETMTNHMEAAIEAGKLALCKHYNEWEDGQIVWESPTDIQEEINEFEDATRSAIIAALPHIRAMVAEEIVSQHQDYVCTNYENPGDDDHPRACVWEIIENIAHQLTGTNQITDNAAKIAEGNRP